MSLTIKGIITFALAWAADKAGLPAIAEGQVEVLINGVLIAAQVVGIVVAYIGRVRKGDITWYGAKI